MGIVIQPGTAILVGFHNDATERGHGIQLTAEGDVNIGTWVSDAPWDVDYYHSYFK